jgi:DNA-binding CsgD family transcriptional regulator
VAAEARLSYAALGDLLRDHLPDLLDALPAPRRRALAAALLLDADGAHGANGADVADALGVGLALLDSLRRLAADGRVVVAVDDLQWIDPPTRDALAFALRRLRSEPVAFLATVRAGDAAAGTAFEPPPFVRTLRLGPLSLAATYQLIRARLGLTLTRPELVRVHEAAAGNPLFALEVAAELVRARASAPGAPLAVHGDLAEHLGRRVRRLASATRDVLLVAAATLRPTRELLRLAADDAPRIDAALIEAEEAGVIAPGSDPVRFTHPLLAASCQAVADLPAVRHAHRRLSRLVADPEERARHQALASEGGPDGRLARTLEAAAGHAARRGAAAAAAELMEMAAARTPAAAAPDRRARLLQAGEWYRLAGDRGRAGSVLAQLLPQADPGRERARVLFALARVEPLDLRRAVALAEEALREGGDDDALAASVLTYLCWLRMLQGDIRTALRDAREALARAERTGDPELIARAIARVAMSETWTMDVTPGLLERGVQIEESLGRWLELHASPRWTLARRLKVSDELDAARALMDAADTDAIDRGDEASHTLVQFFRVGLEIASGRWREALRAAHMGVELAEQIHNQQLRGMMVNALAEVLVLLGRVDEARPALQDSLAISQAAADELIGTAKLETLGLLELSLGNARAAADILRPLPERMLSLGWMHPMVVDETNAIEALIGIGELEAAERYLSWREERAARAGVPTALATAARCRGLLTAARGDLSLAVEQLEGAVPLHPREAHPFERARTLLALGAVRRRARQKRAARDVLGAALEAFSGLGARLWAGRARDELRQIGGRRKVGKDLTETERQLAELIARGMSNREAAAALFITVHTVESHLTTIYRKLGIRSRTELALRMRAATTGPYPR